ncbi:MAG: hypothetical protein M0D55_14340 [Elusimicrobiota bacterium]|nr:MAG: hypothetical protein M0D55_14340 [Elusimicrobiota bacterium]
MTDTRKPYWPFVLPNSPWMFVEPSQRTHAESAPPLGTVGSAVLAEPGASMKNVRSGGVDAGSRGLEPSWNLNSSKLISSR